MSKSMFAKLNRPGFLIMGRAATLPKTVVLPESLIRLELFAPNSSVAVKCGLAGFSIVADLVKVIRSIPEWDVISGQKS